MKYDQFKTFDELSEEAKKRAIRSDRLFSLCNNFPTNSKKEIQKQLYKSNGDIACMTTEERNRWGG